MADKVMLFIPAYNCEKQIGRVIGKIDTEVQSYLQEVVVVENRSTDDTLNKAIEATSMLRVKATVMQNDENYSLGGSVKRALLYAVENGYDYLAVLHGDDQADVRDLLPVFATGLFTKNDLVIGARFHPQSQLEGYSSVRKAGNRVLNMAFAVVSRQRVYDLIAGLNLFRVGFFGDGMYLNFPNNLTFDAHTLLYAFSKKARITYVPVTWREEDQISNAKTVKQAVIILRLLARYVFSGKRVFAANKSGRPVGFSYPSTIVSQVNA